MLTFYFTKADGRMTTPETLTAGMVGARAKIEFSSEWDTLVKTAVFYAEGIIRDVVMVDNVVVIPHEVLKMPTAQLYVGVYGVSSDGKTVIPTIRARGPVIQPGADPSGDPGTDPTLPVWAQLQAQTEALGDQVDSVREQAYLLKLQTDSTQSLTDLLDEQVGSLQEQTDALEHRVDALQGTEGSVSEEQVIDIVENYLANHGVELPDAPEPGEDDIPKVFFGGALQQTKTEAVVPFRYISKTQDFSGYAEIKAQGNSSMNYPKKNQTVKLFQDAACTEKLKVDFKGWGKQNKHVYKANWIDLSHARNVVSARLWADVVKSRSNYAELPELLRASPNQGAIDGFPVKVYAAGIYQGRYTLNIPKDKWTFNMDDDLDEHCVLCGENYVSGCFRAAANINESDWTDEIHDTVPSSIKTRWNQVISFVMNSTDADFRANLNQYFFVDSLIDYYLFALASCGLDAMGKNQIYMTYDGQRWIASMYDMDSTWGLYWDGSKFVASDYARTSYEDYVSSGSGGEGNLLYNRLEQLFREELQTRWAELKNGALSIENIINRFERFTDIAPADLVKEDYASTTGGGRFTGIPSKTTNHIQQIRSFALARQTWTDDYVTGLTGSSHTHSYTSKVTTAAACTTAGVRTYTCGCGDTYTESIPATGHSWNDGVVTVAPTEETEGVKTYTCTRCGETYTESIPTLDHTHSYTSQVVAPTCTEQGYTEHICACGDSYTDTYVAALGHNYVDGVCSVCGAADPNYNPNATYLYTNYSPNGASFMKTEAIDWAAGDCIEAEIDVTNCTGGTSYECLLSVGMDIANWGGKNLHLYYQPSSKTLQVDYVNISSNTQSRRTAEITDNIVRCVITSEAVTFNGTEFLAADAAVNGPPTVAAWLESSTIQIGSMEGATRSNATYNYIRIVKG